MESIKPNILQIIAENIIRFRKEKGISQEQLAHDAGIDRSYMGYIENAKHNVSVTVLEKIAHSLNTSVAKLVS